MKNQKYEDKYKVMSSHGLTMVKDYSQGRYWKPRIGWIYNKEEKKIKDGVL